MKDQAIYSSEHIQNLQFPENVRTNASMYLGSTDADGRWLVVRELLDNGLDEFLAKRNDAVYLYEEQDDSYTVIDNGFGIPQGTKEYTVYLDGKSVKSSIPTMQAIFGQLNTSGKYRSEAYKVSIGCFVGETPVQLLDGRTLSFEELYKEFQQKQEPIPIWSWDTKKDQVAFTCISNVMLTKHVKHLVDVTLDNGVKIRCTPDHPFFVRTETGIKKVYAENLQKDASLVTMHVQYGEGGYATSKEITRNNSGLEKSLYRAVYAYYHGKESIVGKHVHHIDRNPSNNVPSNLIALTNEEHAYEHRFDKSKAGREICNRPEIKKIHAEKIAQSNRDPELNKRRKLSKTVNSLARVLLIDGKVTPERYNALRLTFAPNFSEIKDYNTLLEKAKEKVAFIKNNQGKKYKADRLYVELTKDRTTQVHISKVASDAARLKNWFKNIDNCLAKGYSLDEITEDVYFECNKSKTPQKYSCIDVLHMSTSLDELKRAYKEKTYPRFYKNQSELAKETRLERSSIARMSPENRARIVHLFVLASRRAKDFSRESYEAVKSCAHPNWIRGVEAIKYTQNVSTLEEVEDFVRNYNHTVVSVEHIYLDREVPVYGMTVDNTHAYFIQDCLVCNSHGCGSKGSNATSEFFHVKTCYQGKWYEIEFKQGHLTIPVRECQQPIYRGKPLQKGTMIHFKHDKQIFGTTGIDFKLAESWAEITSYLNPGFHVTLQDKHNNIRTYYSEQGPSEYVEKLIDQLHAQREEQLFTFKNELCDIVVAFSNAENCNVRGYTNGLYNSDGGKHVDSVCQALFNVVKDFAKSKQTVQLQDFKEGLVGIINMHLHKAEFSSQDKLKLTDERAGDSLRQQIQVEADKFFKKNKELALRLCEKSSKLSELRSQFKASKKMIAALNQAKKRGMPAKYSPFDSKTKVEDRELLIVEGLSAAGGLRQVRKPYQSLYPIRGKCIHPETEILTNIGLVKVKDIKDNFIGYQYDFATNTYKKANLSKPFVSNTTNTLIELEFDDGTKLQCTPDHLILTDHGWVEAQYLTEEDEFLCFKK